MDVIDRIEGTETDGRDKPVNDIRIESCRAHAVAPS